MSSLRWRQGLGKPKRQRLINLPARPGETRPRTGTLRFLPPGPNKGWRTRPGYKVMLANRGDARFDFPGSWVVKMPGEQCDVELRDKPFPEDNCLIQVSIFTHPPGIDWQALPIETLARDADRDDDPDTLWRSGWHHVTRPGAELVWAERHFVDEREKREARSRQCFARGPRSHALITMSYWPEHETRFRPVWDELLRTLTLGVYVRDPYLGE